MEHSPAMRRNNYERMSRQPHGYELMSRLPYSRSDAVYVECLICEYNNLLPRSHDDYDHSEYKKSMARSVLASSAHCARVGCRYCYPVYDERCRELRPVIVEVIREDGSHVANDAVAILLLASGPPYTDILDALSNATDEFKRRWAADAMNLPLSWMRPDSDGREFMRQSARALRWSPASRLWRLALSRLSYSADQSLGRTLTVVLLMTGVEGCVWWLIPPELLYCIAEQLYMLYCDDVVRPKG